MKKLLIFKIPAILFMFLLISCSGNESDSRLYEDFATAGEASLRDVISRTGLVQPVVNVDLQSEASGRIERVAVKEGQEVSRGDTIIVIDPSRLRTQREKLRLSIRRADLDRQKARRDYENAQQLQKTGSVSNRNVEDFRIAHELASINYQQQLLELKDIDEQLSKTVVTSPLDGVVTSLLVKEGEIAVSAVSGFQSGTAIGTIADISQLEVITSIGEVDYIHLRQGQNVIIRPEAIENTETNGSIRFISLSAQRRDMDELGSFEVRASIDSLIPGIAPGINVNVEFVILEKDVEVAVPYHFVRKSGERSFVRVVSRQTEDNTYTEEVEVQTGSTDYRNYEIVSGLSGGEKIYFRYGEGPQGAHPSAGRRRR
ncbi:efflux transporter, RND family, MFP subunit [Chitinispirillum alkaliphilum]|nr:efflux transporter, RND family, MFP subunit [Chitinispirillum alkaliphilum]